MLEVDVTPTVVTPHSLLCDADGVPLVSDKGDLILHQAPAIPWCYYTAGVRPNSIAIGRILYNTEISSNVGKRITIRLNSGKVHEGFPTENAENGNGLTVETLCNAGTTTTTSGLVYQTDVNTVYFNSCRWDDDATAKPTRAEVEQIAQRLIDWQISHYNNRIRYFDLDSFEVSQHDNVRANMGVFNSDKHVLYPSLTQSLNAVGNGVYGGTLQDYYMLESVPFNISFYKFPLQKKVKLHIKAYVRFSPYSNSGLIQTLKARLRLDVYGLTQETTLENATTYTFDMLSSQHINLSASEIDVNSEEITEEIIVTLPTSREIAVRSLAMINVDDVTTSEVLSHKYFDSAGFLWISDSPYINANAEVYYKIEAFPMPDNEE